MPRKYTRIALICTYVAWVIAFVYGWWSILYGEPLDAVPAGAILFLGIGLFATLVEQADDNN